MRFIDELKAEHDLIDAVAGAFRTFAARSERPVDVGDLGQFLWFFRLYAGDFHHAREERALFPALVERAHLPGDRGPVAVLTDDHRRMSGQLAEMERLLLSDLALDANRAALYRLVQVYARALQHHIDAENSVLFPESEARLRKQGVQELNGRAMTEAEREAREAAEALLARYPPSSDAAAIRGDGCVLCPAMGEACAGLEAEWWNEWEWEEFEDHLPSG
jgi:hemerythrin-like domain-containing protein